MKSCFIVVLFAQNIIEFKSNLVLQGMNACMQTELLCSTYQAPSSLTFLEYIEIIFQVNMHFICQNKNFLNIPQK